ncbi:MAG: hypothetical protein CMM25_08010 [Rhodospirillaceae bacterium]|nr:hypothetical protein [Rhodospirillaceae bacterium]|tara:strand:+ start:100 stop:570 length:471 start_codon:yes stop_codon:yes gene_type:complete
MSAQVSWEEELSKTFASLTEQEKTRIIEPLRPLISKPDDLQEFINILLAENKVKAKKPKAIYAGVRDDPELRNILAPVIERQKKAALRARMDNYQPRSRGRSRQPKTIFSSARFGKIIKKAIKRSSREKVGLQLYVWCRSCGIPKEEVLKLLNNRV